MITRVFRVRIKPELRTAFERDFQELPKPLIKSQPGLVSMFIGKPTKWAVDEYAMISVWMNDIVLEDFAGKEWNQPVIPRGMERYVDECWVHHYEQFR